MKSIRFVSVVALLLLSACLTNPKPIGVAESVEAAAWEGVWKMESSQTHESYGHFRVTSVDPEEGQFTAHVSDAGGNVAAENASDDRSFALHLRRVGDQLFLTYPADEDGNWVVLPVAELSPGRIVICFQPNEDAFEARIDDGTFKAKTQRTGNLSMVAFDALSEDEIDFLSKHLDELYLPDRTLLTRVAPAN